MFISPFEHLLHILHEHLTLDELLSLQTLRQTSRLCRDYSKQRWDVRRQASLQKMRAEPLHLSYQVTENPNIVEQTLWVSLEAREEWFLYEMFVQQRCYLPKEDCSAKSNYTQVIDPDEINQRLFWWQAQRFNPRGRSDSAASTRCHFRLLERRRVNLETRGYQVITDTKEVNCIELQQVHSHFTLRHYFELQPNLVARPRKHLVCSWRFPHYFSRHDVYYFDSYEDQVWQANFYDRYDFSVSEFQRATALLRNRLRKTLINANVDRVLNICTLQVIRRLSIKQQQELFELIEQILKWQRVFIEPNVDKVSQLYQQLETLLNKGLDYQALSRSRIYELHKLALHNWPEYLQALAK